MGRKSPGLNSRLNVNMRRKSALTRLLEIKEEERNATQLQEITTLTSRIKNNDRASYVLRRKSSSKKKKGTEDTPEQKTYDFRWGVYTLSVVRRSRSQRVTKTAGSGRKNNKKKSFKKKKEYALTLMSGGLYDPAKKTAQQLRQEFYGKRFVIKAVRKL